MGKAIKALMIAITMLVMGVTASLAQDLGKGFQAWIRGNYEAALQELRPLAEHGDDAAQNILGLMYKNGDGVPQDYAEAVKWFRMAAEQGHVGAQLDLGRTYYQGQGIIQDMVYAHMWSNIAASRGEGGAKKWRDLAAKLMTASQIAEAQKLARECVQKNYKGC